MRYQAAIFDLFGTLVPPFTSGPFQQLLAESAAALGTDVAAFRRLWVYDTADARMTGAYGSLEGDLEHIARTLGVALTPSQLAAAVQARLAFYRRAMAPRPDAVATLRALKGLGLRLGLISDCSSEAPLLWPETPFATLIDVPVFSCTEGVRKPDPRLFRLACARLGVEPRGCIYVADGFHGELATARALGMEAVLLDVPGEVTLEFAPDEAATWTGPRIRALSELVGLAGQEEPL